MLNTLYKKFIFVTILFVLIFVAWYVKLSQFENGLLAMELSNRHNSTLVTEITSLEELIWKMRLIEYEMLSEMYVQEGDSSVRFTTNNLEALEVAKSLMSPSAHNEFAQGVEGHVHPDFVVRGATDIYKTLNTHTEIVEKLVQLQNKSKLYEARFRANYSSLISFATMTDNFDLFKKIYTLAKFHEVYYASHSENDYKAILNVLVVIEQKGMEVVEGDAHRSRLQRLFTKYRKLVGIENQVAGELSKVYKESAKSYVELVDVMSTMTLAIENLQNAKSLEANQRRKDLKANAYLVGALALILMFLCQYLILKHFVGPARSLFMTIEKIKKGESGAREDLRNVKGSGEIRQLADSLNKMLITIDANQKELVSYQEQLEDKVTKLDSSEKELKEKHDELSHQFDDLQNTQTQLIEAEKQAALGKLVAGVAHEVNTPIGISLSYTSFLKDQVTKLWADYENGQFKRSSFEKCCKNLIESLTASEESLGRAANLIQSFKQTAADQSVETIRKFDINSYIVQSLLSLKTILKSTKHRIDFDPVDEIMVDSFPGAITQVLTNLINNSMIHGYDDDQAGIFTLVTAFDEEKKMVIMTYTDDGKGMTEEVLAKMYDPFFTTNMGGGGTGLGMHIIFNLIRQTLQGTIDCESSPGCGTKFTIVIPQKIK